MSDPEVNLKTPWVAGLLAYLVPGAGHLYQRRFFKAGIYFVCILGTLLYGLKLGEWKVIYWTENSGREAFQHPTKKNFGFLAQLGGGIPAIYAYIQSRRYRNLENHPTIIYPPVNGEKEGAQKQRESILHGLNEPLNFDFQGKLTSETGTFLAGKTDLTNKEVTGTIHLEPRGDVFQGTFEGTIKNNKGDSEKFNYSLGKYLFVDSRVLNDPRRRVVVGLLDNNGEMRGKLEGSSPRSFGNWFAAPHDEATLQKISRNLNKRFEMALVYTWIAGLLNILAIWDAVQGAAYGYYGPQKPNTDDDDKDENKSNDENKSSATSPASDEQNSVTEEKPSQEKPVQKEASPKEEAPETVAKNVNAKPDHSAKQPPKKQQPKKEA